MKMKIVADKRKNILNGFLDFVFFAAGSAIYGLGIHMFAVPNNISNGGVTGVATVLNYLFPVLPIGATMLVLNVPLFILAFLSLGRKMFIKSFAATIILSVATDIIAPFVPSGTDNRLLASIFYGVCTGVGLALILMRGATSGGSDILGMLLNKKYPHIPIGRALFAIDCLVVIFSGIVFGSIEDALYAAIVVFIAGEIIDTVLYGMDKGKTFLIVTEKVDEITASVTENMDRGISIVPIKGGYTREDKTMLICAVRASEAAKLNRIIRTADPDAFTIVVEAGEITGEGFKNTGGEEK